MLTKCAEKNWQLATSEFKRRKRAGLITLEVDSVAQVLDYIKRSDKASPEIASLTNRFQCCWTKEPNTVIAIPAAGFARQEITSIRQTLEKLSLDRTISNGDTGIVILANRPQGEEKDETAKIAEEIIYEKGLNAVVIESEISQNLGVKSKSFSEGMAVKENEVPIALLRDILIVAVMKKWLASLTETRVPPLPIILQMDADFEGFKKGDLSNIERYFQKYPQKTFLQCSSDWDSRERPTKTIPLLKLGATLMLLLPQVLKESLNDPSLPRNSRKQIIFGEAIQRGIQVPQAERIASIAKKGGYGLLRLKEDELDLNIRMSAIVNGLESVGSDSETIFLWSNRRAVRSFVEEGAPPISQWVTSFAAMDQVRINPTETSANKQSSELDVINKTLARFPLPVSLSGVYTRFDEVILNTLQPIVNLDKLTPTVKTLPNRTNILQFANI